MLNDWDLNFVELENGKKVEKEHFFEAKLLRRLTKESEKYPLLTREQEQEYIRAYQEPRDALYALAQATYGKEKYPDPSSWGSPEERAVIKAIVNPNGTHYNKTAQIAREKMVLHNLRLIKRFGKANKVGDLGPYDLHIYGMLGLQHALDKFDRTKTNGKGQPNKFSTYAVNWIRQYLQRGVVDFGRTIRIPIHIHDQINKLGKIYARLSSEHFDSASPTPEKLAEASGMPVEHVKVLGFYKADFSITSLDKENFSDDDESSTLLDSIGSELDTEAIVEKEANKEALHRLIDSALSPEDAKFAYLYYGLIDGSPRNVREMASAQGRQRKDVQEQVDRIMSTLQASANREEFCLE